MSLAVVTDKKTPTSIPHSQRSAVNYGKPDYQASQTVIGESEWVMGAKDDA